jgi:thiol-disulfide isomerase/thioredoxin
MKKRTMSYPILVIPALLLALNTHAQAASIGDPAPALSIERWIKGAPARPGPGTNIYVVEFWATWCGPCKRSIPHLTEMQREYGPKGVIIVGISDEKPETVAKFVAAQGDSMAYRVAVDTSKRSFRAWMTAYGKSGIPHAFVVDQSGKVAWHGFPSSSLDGVLSEMTSGTYNIEKVRELENGDRAIAQYKSMVSRSNAAEGAAKVGESILDNFASDWRIPHRLAKTILTDPAIRSRDIPLALKASTKAVEMTREGSSDAMEINARALFASGKKREAVEMQKKAIARCSRQEEIPEMKKFLALYEKGAAAN